MAQARGRPRALALAALLALAACATPATPEHMTVDTSSPAVVSAGPVFHALRLGQITGSGETNAAWFSGVSNHALSQALEGSLRNLNVLAGEASAARYVVSVDVVDLDRPGVVKDPVAVLVPIDLSVTARIHYKVTPAAGGPAVFDEIVATTGTATGADSLVPDQRVRLALEDAMRANIAEFVDRLRKQLS